MRKRKLLGRLMQAELLAAEVHAYVRETEHPVPDGYKRRQDYKAMVRALRAFEEGRG